MKKNIKNVILPLLFVILFLFLWELLDIFKLVDNSLLPSPLAISEKFAQLLFSGSLNIDFLSSFVRMLCGFSIATIIGISFGLIIGLFKSLYNSVIFSVDFFRSIPVTALYPVFVIFFGIGHFSKITMVFWACFFVIILNSAYGVVQSKKLRSDMARLYGATKFQTIKWITFFDALPQTMIGLRIGISYALIVEILAEMFMGSQYGIGQRITEAYTKYSMEELFSLIFISGILGYVLNRIFVYFEKRLTFWVQE